MFLFGCRDFIMPIFDSNEAMKDRALKCGRILQLKTDVAVVCDMCMIAI